MKKLIAFYLCFIVNASYSQGVKERLMQAVQEMKSDPQLRHAIIAISVVNSKTGKPVYEHNAQVGLAPASTQKLFTSCAAFDLLGKDYRYTTAIGYKNVKGSAAGYLFITASGDPSFGSSRFAATKPGAVLTIIVTALKRNKISPVNESIKTTYPFSFAVPGSWMWEDIGNYYGAAAQSFNWLENQYDIIVKSGNNIGDTAVIAGVHPAEAKTPMEAKLLSAAKGSGDNTIVYLPYGNDQSLIEGSVPVNENAFSVSASITQPLTVFSRQLINEIKKAGIPTVDMYNGRPGPSLLTADSALQYTELYKHFSPPLDSLNYWFLKKSINLYGEALIKTMAFQQTGTGTTEKGVALLKDFWASHGIEKSAVNIFDGSGLSPQNRVTADALVKVLQYAKTRPWFSSFYYALPEYNGMKMKSGSITGSRAYAGYHTAGNGNEYVFAIVVNNYTGTALAAVRALYRVLDNLK